MMAFGESVVVADIAVRSCQRSGQIVLAVLRAKKEAKDHLIFYFHPPNLARTGQLCRASGASSMDRFKQIETFVTVAAKGSLSAAALAEGVAPAIIGRRIDALEERLGVKLLVRTTRKITLTFEGSAFLEDCQRIIHDMQNAEASVSAGGVKASGHLRLSAPAGFGRRHVAPLVPAFTVAHPDVSITLDLSDRLVDLVNEG